MRSYATVLLVTYACIALYKFDHGRVSDGLYWGVLALVAAAYV